MLALIIAIITSKGVIAQDDVPVPIDLSTAKECLRSSPGKFTNYCNFTIAFTWCFHIGGTDPNAWKTWINGSNSCGRSVHRMSPPIKPNKTFLFPMKNIPESPDGKWVAGLLFVKAVRFP